MDTKALVLDIDGTLTNSKKEITEATRQAIFDVMNRGHKVVLASGRPTPGMKKAAASLRFEETGVYLLSVNGARIVDCGTRQILYQRILPLTLLPGLYRFARENGCGLITYLGDEVISAFAPDRYVEIEARINGLPIRTVERFVEFVDFDINKCLMTADPDRAEELERRRQARMRERQRILDEREMEYRAQQERLRHKTVVVDRTYLAVLIIASLFTLGLCFSYIQMQTSINTRISSIETKKQQLDKLKSENDALQNSIDTSVNLDEIYRVATQELGMVYAGKDQTITYDKTESEYVRHYEDIPKY